MAYNKAKEEYRWNQWKAEEEKILREQGVDEVTIQKLREYDWDDFKAERRFREHQTSLLDCMELLLEEKETEESQPESVEALLDTVENEDLLQILLSTDKKTLQMVVMKMMGYVVFASKANYLFFKGRPGLEKEALEAGFLIRDCQNYEGLSEGFYRIAVRTKEENERLITWLGRL